MDTIFFMLSKAGWLLLRPETVLVLLYVLGTYLLWRNRIHAARWMLTLALAVTVLVGFVPVGYLLLDPLERSYPAAPQIDKPAGILILGGAEDQGPGYAGNPAEVNEAGDRLITGMMLAQRFPDALVLYSGGKSALKPAEAGVFEIGPDVLRLLGLSETRLIVESRSRTTAENAALSRSLLPEGTEGPWVLVTSAFHMPRAMGSFCAAGWRNLIAYPTDYRAGNLWADLEWDFAGHLKTLNTGMKEWIGLLAYRLTGRLGPGFPAGC